MFEDLNDELVIVYVQDAEHRVRFLMSNEDLGVERSALRKLAVENLGRIRPKIEMHSLGNKLAMFDVGGTYEASLLLFDTIWTDGQVKVNGDIVVAVPTRDALLVTGSKNRKGLSVLRKVAAKFAAERSNPISDKLFVYRDGQFKEFGAQVAICSAFARSPTLSGPAFAPGFFHPNVRHARRVQSEPSCRSSCSTSCPIDRHFDEFKPGRHMPFPLPGRYFEPRDRGALLRAASRRVGGDGPARL